MSRPAKIVSQTSAYLSNALDIIRKQEDPARRLEGGARLMKRIIELNKLYEASFLELRGLLELRTKP